MTMPMHDLQDERTVAKSQALWERWRGFTPARIGLGRAGNGMPTQEVLRLGWAHAMARDAIHLPLDVPALAQRLAGDGFAVLQAHSSAPDRATYLRRPDLGRRLAPESAAQLQAALQRGGTQWDLCFVVADGLSSLAAMRHAAPILTALRPLLPAELRTGPVIVATQARVALADEIGDICGARLSIILIGERPGLSSPDSLGVYLTHAPRRGRTDAERNCISNIRPEGLPYDAAAHKLAWLVRESLRQGLTGVGLKDESAVTGLAGDAAQPLPDA